MNEQDTAQKLKEYSQSIGRCERIPIPHKKSNRRLVLVPLSLAAVATVLFAAWPRDASAATLQRFIHAVTNVHTMVGITTIQGASGKTMPFARMSYEGGRWRREGLQKNKNRFFAIYKDEACYEDHAAFGYATIRPISERDRLPIEGDALEVVKAEFRLFAGRTATMTIDSSPNVNGREAYRIILDQKSYGRRVEIVVDKKTDLPISADTWSAMPKQHAHTDYTFNQAFPDGFFDLPKNRKVVDLRKTIPVRVATWTKPIVSVNGLDVMDAQVTGDGTVWLVTRSTQSKSGGVQIRDLEGVKGQLFSKGLVSEIQGQPYQVYSFNPLEKTSNVPTKGVLGLDSIFWPAPTSSMPEGVTPGGRVTSAGRLEIKIRQSHEAAYPSYMSDIGLEHMLREAKYWTDFGRAQKLQQLKRWREAGQAFERIGDGTSPDFGGYENWMKQAIQCYQRAGAKADQKRVEEKITHPDYSKGLD